MVCLTISSFYKKGQTKESQDSSSLEECQKYCTLKVQLFNLYMQVYVRMTDNVNIDAYYIFKEHFFYI